MVLPEPFSPFVRNLKQIETDDFVFDRIVAVKRVSRNARPFTDIGNADLVVGLLLHQDKERGRDAFFGNVFQFIVA